MGVYLVIGQSGSGKSTFLKTKFLQKSKREKLCYALMKRDLGDYPYESNFRNYIEIGCRKSNTMFVLDEAKTCIPKKEPSPAEDEWDKKFVTWFLNARKCNNMIFIVFHGWREVPLWLLMYTNRVIRFNTKDQIDVQRRRFFSFDEIVESFDAFPKIPLYEFDEIKIR